MEQILRGGADLLLGGHEIGMGREIAHGIIILIIIAILILMYSNPPSSLSGNIGYILITLFTLFLIYLTFSFGLKMIF
jgi:hypothetical protein